MQHGRNHDQRQSHASHPRANNTPPDGPDAELEAEMLRSGRGEVTVSNRDVTIDETGDLSDRIESGGAEPAPTARATQREHERHALERGLGRVPGGEEGHLRDTRRAGVTRQALDEAAREADRRVAGHEIHPTGPDRSK